MSFEVTNMLNFNPTVGLSCELNNCQINDDVFRALFGFDTSPTKDFTAYFDIVIKQQVRRHKKKRINKKWAKRYGYKNIVRHVEATVSGINDTDDGGLEMRLDNLRIGEVYTTKS